MTASTRSFADAVGCAVLLCDGAMGTMLHAAGAALDRALPELSVSNPALVATIHESYLSVGVDIIQTNTFGANRLWLADHGFADRVDEINRAAVRIALEARERSGRDAFVAGSVSPAVTAPQRRRVGAGERMAVLGEQIRSLVAAGVDLLILETFGYLDELVEAVTVSRDICDLPVVAQATFADDGHTLGGETPREVAAVLSDLPITMLGTNCTIGPQRMLPIVADLVRYSTLPVSAQPNAGQPRRIGPRRFEFSIDGSYLARYLGRFAEAGASLVGGCCGTTPTHLAAAAAVVRDISRQGVRPPDRPRPVIRDDRPRPGSRPLVTARDNPIQQQRAVATSDTGTLASKLATHRFVIAAEIAPPPGAAIDQTLETATTLREHGVGLFVVSPRSGARTHLDPLNTALHLQHHTGVETVATVPTWDKTIMTLQADLLGAHALGIRSIVCVTGNPPVLGDYPAVDGVWEVDSLGLVTLLAGLNAGRDSNGLALAARTSFCIGARINPGARDVDAEIARARAKVRAGAQFLVSRPVYDVKPLRSLVTALEPDGVPVLLSVTPLRSVEEAEYLAYEVPDVSIPPETVRAMERAGRGAARATGVKLAAELLGEARSLVGGVVLTAPEDDTSAVVTLLSAVE